MDAIELDPQKSVKNINLPVDGPQQSSQGRAEAKKSSRSEVAKRESNMH